MMEEAEKVYSTKKPKRGWKKIDEGFVNSSMDFTVLTGKAEKEIKKGKQILFVEPKKQTKGFEKFYLYSRKLRKVM